MKEVMNMAPDVQSFGLDHKDYPKSLLSSLQNRAPSIIYCLGNTSLLSANGVGFCGSRRVSDKGINTAKDCAEQVASAGYTVISGGATGVDYAAHRAALEAGGSTVIVLPQGISNFRIKREIKDVWDWKRVLVLSQFAPNVGWKVFRAMERNHIIIALSRAMIVIEAGEKGGTMHAGMMTLGFRRPLYVAVYENMPEAAPGNVRLLELGARSLTKSKQLGRANLKDLFERIAGNGPVGQQGPAQLSLV
jgi:DNA processing protein